MIVWSEGNKNFLLSEEAMAKLFSWILDLLIQLLESYVASEKVYRAKRKEIVAWLLERCLRVDIHNKIPKEFQSIKQTDMLF